MAEEKNEGIEIRAFRGFVPPKEDMGFVQCPPYDVLDSLEALDMVKGVQGGNGAKCFLHVNKPEIDVPECMNDIYDAKVYAKGKSNLDDFVAKGFLKQSDKPELYVYAQEWVDHKQYGILCEVSAVQYGKNLIKKHELTRQKKEEDRTKLTKIQRGNVGPVFLCHKENNDISNIVANIIKNDPYSSFHTSISNKFLVANDDDLKEMQDKSDVVTHTLWRINDDNIIKQLTDLFRKIPALYVADGHHRTKAAFNVYEELTKEEPSNDPNKPPDYNYLMAVVYPGSQLKILDYNRIVKYTNGMDNGAFLKAVTDSKAWNFNKVKDLGSLPEKKLHQFFMFLGGNDDASGWYVLTPTKEGILDKVKNDVVFAMDCSILSDYLLSPILGIKDMRKDNNIGFVGGIHGLPKLEEKIVKWANNNGVAFGLNPTSVEELMNVADANKILPPKSTWFEPKLRSGVVVRRF